MALEPATSREKIERLRPDELQGQGREIGGDKQTTKDSQRVAICQKSNPASQTTRREENKHVEKALLRQAHQPFNTKRVNGLGGATWSDQE